MKRTNKKKMVKEAWFYIRVIIMVIILLFPFIIMLSISSESNIGDNRIPTDYHTS